MAFSFRRLSKGFISTINIVCCLIFLLSLLLPYLNPDSFWIIGFLGIGMPYLVIILLGFLIFWLIFSWRNAAFSLVALLIGYQQIDKLFSFTNVPFATQRSKGQIRVMSWNAARFSSGKPDPVGKAFLAMIKEYNPDVLCFQEFGVFDYPESFARDKIGQLEALGFAYHVQSRDYSRKRYGYSNGLAIFSKLPFAQTKRIPFTSSAESILRADIVLVNDTFHVFNTHLQSFQFDKENYRDINRIQEGEDSMLAASKNILVKMRRAFRNRGSQARQLELQLDSTVYPAIICMDMNDVPNSYAYGRIARNRIDAFDEKGFGIGRTFKYLLPTLRIDYIITDKQFSISQYRNIPVDISDHLPVVADILPLPAKTRLPSGAVLTK